MRLYRINKQEQVAQQMGKIVQDPELDLDSVGVYVARLPRLAYNRIITIIDSAEQEAIRQENERLGRDNRGYLFQ
ncbi:MAG: hypothetical protein EBW12_06925 [Actinobacteria bacterium]|jgi:hypothetical protein|nr:hypothetical protein [Actinomycetota bacterium]